MGRPYSVTLEVKDAFDPRSPVPEVHDHEDAGSRAEVHEDVASRGSTVSTKSKAKGKAVYIFISRALLSSGVQKLSAETETSGGARLAPASGASSLMPAQQSHLCLMPAQHHGRFGFFSAFHCLIGGRSLSVRTWLGLG